MSEYKVDFLLPTRLYRVAPFAYVGPDFRSLPLGVISDIVTHQGRQLQRLYPFTVSKIGKNGSQTDLMFCLVFWYINNDDERVVFLTPPVLLNETGTPEAMEALLVEVEKLAAFIQSPTIEIEQHEHLGGTSSFPTSLSFLSYTESGKSCQVLDPRFLKKWGYGKRKEVGCFECDVSDYNRGMQGSSRKYDTKTTSAKVLKDYRHSREFSATSFFLSRRDDALRPSAIPFFEDTVHLAEKRTKLRFRQSSVEGYVRWTPDLLEAYSPFPLLFFRELERMNFTRGNIFDWGLRARDQELLNSMLSCAVDEMKRRGIQTVQFANVEKEEEFVSECLADRGFKETHKISLLRKEVG